MRTHSFRDTGYADLKGVHSRGVRWFYPDSGRKLAFGWTIHIPTLHRRWQFGGKVSTVGEETLDLHVAFGPVSIWFHIELERPTGRLYRLPAFRAEGYIDRYRATWRLGKGAPDPFSEGWRSGYRRWKRKAAA